MELERDIVLALRQVYDPEIAVNVYDLGLIYELKVEQGDAESGQERGDCAGNDRTTGKPGARVLIKMTLTAPNCPMADYVVEQVRTAVLDVPGVAECEMELVWEPVWDRSRLSEEALVQLGLDE